MKALILLAMVASFASAQTLNERPTPKPDSPPDLIPACPKKAAVYPEGIIFYCPGWAGFVPTDLKPEPSDADNPARLRVLLANAEHGYPPPSMVLVMRQLVTQR